jgi:hypothetical protein
VRRGWFPSWYVQPALCESTIYQKLTFVLNRCREPPEWLWPNCRKRDRRTHGHLKSSIYRYGVGQCCFGNINKLTRIQLLLAGSTTTGRKIMVCTFCRFVFLLSLVSNICVLYKAAAAASNLKVRVMMVHLNSKLVVSSCEILSPKTESQSGVGW